MITTPDRMANLFPVDSPVPISNDVVILLSIVSFNLDVCFLTK